MGQLFSSNASAAKSALPQNGHGRSKVIVSYSFGVAAVMFTPISRNLSNRAAAAARLAGLTSTLKWIQAHLAISSFSVSLFIVFGLLMPRVVEPKTSEQMGCKAAQA